ncbi:DUF3737 family protein, partial [Candidatus Bathyarchaeota archaeon]|nr:DUF3737 family protein [Candidatus Bathyarchaeota archaeon]
AGYDWCSGNGSILNPYRLENIIINASTSPIEAGLIIENTGTDYFIIRNCTVHGLNGTLGVSLGAFTIRDAGNALIANCSANDNENCTALYLINASSTLITNCTFEQHMGGIFFEDASGLSIEENHISNPDYVGIGGTASSVIGIKNNNITGSGQHGILVGELCNLLNLTGNAITGCMVTGIQCNNTITNFNVENNSITNCNEFGVQVVENCQDGTISFNHFTNIGNRSTMVDNSSTNVFRYLNNCSGAIDSLFIDDTMAHYTWSATQAVAPWIAGNGSAGDPYTISGMVFDGEGEILTGLTIWNTTARVNVSGCTFRDYDSDGLIPTAGISLTNATNATVTSNSFSNCDFSLYIENVTTSLFSGNEFSHCWFTIALALGKNVTISENVINSSTSVGMFVYNSEGTIISLNDVDGCIDFGLRTNSRCIIMNNNFTGNGDGIVITNVDNQNITGNVIANNTGCGINCTGGFGLIVNNNTITGNGLHGILTHGYDGNITGNAVNGNTKSGIFLYTGTGNLVRKNIIDENGINGIRVRDSSDELIIGNWIRNNGEVGINITDDSHIYEGIHGNILEGNGVDAIAADGSSDVYHNGNSINGIVYGFGSDGLTISRDTNFYNISIEDASFLMPHWCSGSGSIGDPLRIENITIEGALVIFDLDDGASSDYHVSIENVSTTSQLIIFSSDNVTVNDSFMAGNVTLTDCENVSFHHSSALSVSCSWQVSHVSLVANNFIEGMNLGWGTTHFTVSGNNVTRGGITMLHHLTSMPSINGTIQGNIFSGNLSTWGARISFNYTQNHSVSIRNNTFKHHGKDGIQLNLGNGFTLFNNTIINCTLNGILVNGSSHVCMDDNEIHECAMAGMVVSNSFNMSLGSNVISSCAGNGIILDGALNTTIEGNELVANGGSGIALVNGTDFGTVQYNHLELNDVGIYLSGGSDNNTIFNNTVIDSIQHGIVIMNISVDCSDNLVFFNEFITPAGTNAFNNASSNAWDNGSLGNYWGDYLIHYPNATRFGLTWTTPYEITLGAQDNHPYCGDFIPRADFVSNATTILSGQQVSFTFTGDEGNYPSVFAWDFNDTTTASSMNASHEFTLAGIFNVSLAVSDHDGDIAFQMMVITVLEPSGDADADGLTNQEELEQFSTNPLEHDTDNDGLGDGAEINQHSTDPNIQDTDGDGLIDGDEINVHGTNPIDVDTDGDGVGDGDEIAKGTNPLLNPKKIALIITIVSSIMVAGVLVVIVLHKKDVINLKRRSGRKFTND